MGCILMEHAPPPPLPPKNYDLTNTNLLALGLIHTKVTKISTTTTTKSMFSLIQQDCRDYLENFQKSFVLVTADKARTSIIIVLCRKRYLDLALDISDWTSPQTSTCCSTPLKKLVIEHKEFIDRQNLRISEEMKQLPSFYCLPKMHYDKKLQ